MNNIGNLSLLYSNTMFACVFVCLWPISSGTAGPIWLNFFLLAPSWSRDGFRPKKFRIQDPVFPKIRKNRFWREILKYFCKNVRIFMWKIFEIIVLSNFTNSVIYYLLRRKGRATSKSVEGAQPPPPDSDFSRLRLWGEATSNKQTNRQKYKLTFL